LVLKKRKDQGQSNLFENIFLNFIHNINNLSTSRDLWWKLSKRGPSGRGECWK